MVEVSTWSEVPLDQFDPNEQESPSVRGASRVSELKVLPPSLKFKVSQYFYDGTVSWNVICDVDSSHRL